MTGQVVIASPEECSWWFQRGSIVLVGVIANRSHKPLVCVHEDVHQQMQENTPFHQFNGAVGQTLIKTKGLPMEATKQEFLNVKVKDEEQDA